MGNKLPDSKNRKDFESSSNVNKNSFEFISVIGRGGFGKVWKVHNNQYNKTYAMKEMSKVTIIDGKSEISIQSERD